MANGLYLSDVKRQAVWLGAPPGDGGGVPAIFLPGAGEDDGAVCLSDPEETGHGEADVDALDLLKVPRSGSDDDLSSVSAGINHLSLRKQTSYRKAIEQNWLSGNAGLVHPTMDTKRWEGVPYVDWLDSATVGEHIWVDTNASGDFCYVSEAGCVKFGPRKKCTACKILIHAACLPILLSDKMRFKCKPTFREATPRNYRENVTMRHHWVHRRRQEGKCKQCNKSFQQKFTFQNKEILAISCSWCKAAYHNKFSCFTMQHLDEQCTLGQHANIIVPPSWIIKLPRRDTFKSSIRKQRRLSVKQRRSHDDYRPFVIKPVPTPHMKPLIAFVNPKSGGNQGTRVLRKLQWLLNPRQVFDLSLEGPKNGLELYRKVPNLRVLACGGDGTAGWILSTIDTLGIRPPPAVAILPLGTGNDLARTLNWGGGYTDEPLSKVLNSVAEGPIVQLDRWEISVIPNSDVSPDASEESGMARLPLDVMNNYFSLGADAHVTLEFHESREANPEKFNSRFRNKMFYAGAGGKDLLKRSWKDLADYIRVECDGVDLTPKIKDLKLHCLLFLNIPKYASGTTPWGSVSASWSGFEPQRLDDGYIEVVGFTTTQLAALQVGGHGERLVQCQTVRLTTLKTIPMQVDGEPCRLLPSIITIKLLCKSNVIQKPKRLGGIQLQRESHTTSISERLRIQVSCISMADYEVLHYDKDKLRDASIPVGLIIVDTDADLEQIRKHINRLIEDTIVTASKPSAKISLNWCFVDSTTAERFFRIDRAQEHLHYVTDISSEDLYILDPELQVSFVEAKVNSDLSGNAVSTHAKLAYSSVEASAADHDSPLPDPWRMQRDHTNSDMPQDTPSPDVTASTDQISLSPPNHKPLVRVSVTKPATGLSAFDKAYLDAAKRGDINKLVEAQEAGADLQATDQYGMTALHHAARFGHKGIVTYLIEQGPKELLEMVDLERGQTALHKAAWYQRKSICQMLVEAGASLSKKDYQGCTARQQAEKAEDSDLTAFLAVQEALKPPAESLV